MTAQLDFTATLDAPPAKPTAHTCADCLHLARSSRLFNGLATFTCTSPKGYGYPLDGIRQDFPVTTTGWHCWEGR